MSEASYTAWDDNLYEWPPPDGWYQADDGKWWPQGYGPRGDRSGEPGGNNGSDELLYEIERTSIFPAGGSGLMGGSSKDRLRAESQRPVYDELPNIDDVFFDSNDRDERNDREAPPVDEPADHDYEPSNGSGNTDDGTDNVGVIELSSADVEAASLEGADLEVAEPGATDPGATEGEAAELESVDPGATDPGAAEGEAAELESVEPDGELDRESGVESELGAAPDIEEAPVGEPDLADAELDDVVNDELVVEPLDDDDPQNELVDAEPATADTEVDAAADDDVVGDGVAAELVVDPVVDETADTEVDDTVDAEADDDDVVVGDEVATELVADVDEDVEVAADDTASGPETAPMVTGFHLGELPDESERDRDFPNEDDDAAYDGDEYDRNDDHGNREPAGDNTDEVAAADDPADIDSEHDDADLDPAPFDKPEGEPTRSLWPVVGAVALVVAVLVVVLAFVVLSRDEPSGAFDAQAALAVEGEGSLSQPYPAGSGAIIYYIDTATDQERRWVIQIVEPVADRTEQLVAERGAQAPPDGSVLALTTVRVTYRDGPAPGPVSDLELAAIGPSLVLFEAAARCRGVTDQLDQSVGLEPGQAIEGELCWQVPEEDLADLKLAIEAGPVDGTVFVDLES